MAIELSEIDREHLAALEEVARDVGQTEAELLNGILRHFLHDVSSIRKGHDDYLNGRVTEIDEADAEFRRKHDISND